jgi:hypothetical protein
MVAYAYVTASLVVWDEDPDRADAKLAAGREGHHRPRLHCHQGADQRGRGVARNLAGSDLRQCPPAAALDLNLAHMIAAVGGVGGARVRTIIWAGRRFSDGQDRRLDAVSARAARRRRRPHPGRRPDRRRQERAAGADGPAVSPLRGARIVAFDFGGSIRAATLAMGGSLPRSGRRPAGRRSSGRRPAAPGPIDDPAQRVWAAELDRRPPCARRRVVTPAVAITSGRLWRAWPPRPSRSAPSRGWGAAAHAGPEERPGALHPGRTMGAAARRRARGARGQCGPGLRDRRAAGHARRASGARLPLSPHRARLDGAADPDPGRRGLAGARRRGVRRRSCANWLKTVRKKNASVVLRHPVLDRHRRQPDRPGDRRECARPGSSCPIRAPWIRRARRFTAALAQRPPDRDPQPGHPKRDYYVQSRAGERLFDLGLGPIALAFCAAVLENRPGRHRRGPRQGHGPDFADAWLRHRRLPWAADLLTSITLPESSR